MSTLEQRVVTYLQKSSVSTCKPGQIMADLGVTYAILSPVLQRLTNANILKREKLPGHNQYGYATSGKEPVATDYVAPPPTTRIIWSAVERLQVLQQAHSLLAARQGLSFREAVLTAQRVLPEHRRRGNPSGSFLADMRAAYQLMPKPAVDEPPSLPSSPPSQDLDQAQDLDLTEVAPLEAKVDTVREVPIPPADPLGDMLHRLVDAIACNIADQLLETLTHRINASLSRLTPPTLSAAPTITRPALSPSAPAAPKLRFVVAGLKGHQKTEVLNGLPQSTQVSFWSVDESPQQLKSMCRDADQVFLMTKFVSHSHESTIRAVAPDRLVRINGGVTTLRDQIHRSSAGL